MLGDRPMKRTLIALVLTACGSSSGGGETLDVDNTVLSFTHTAGNDPRGYLHVESQGKWMYGLAESCRYTQGEMESARVEQIKAWVGDDSLKPFITRGKCQDTDYVVSTYDFAMCWPQDAMPQSEPAKALFSLFSEYAGKLEWDGVKRDCNMPNLTPVPSGNTKQTDPPPPPRAGAAGAAP
jgi:hypothetical protein